MFLRTFFILLLLAFGFANAARKSFAIMPCVGNPNGAVLAEDLERLRDKLEEVSREVLPNSNFRLIPYKDVAQEIDEEELFNACAEQGACFGRLTAQVNADYGAWCKVNKYKDGKLSLKFELYSVGEKDLIYTKEYDNYKPKNVEDMIKIIKTEVPIAIREKIPGVVKKSSKRIIEGGIGGVQTTGGDYELNEKLHLVRLSTEPSGAILSFNGEPDTRKTPYNLELAEGRTRIIAALEQYEKADTTVLIKQNNQSINIKLKPNFGVLEVKPAYLDGIGKDVQWSLFIDGKAIYSLEKNLPPNKYKVWLGHKCYESLNFDVGINKGKREVFDIASHIKLKKGGLVLKAERGDEPVSEPVFVNGKKVGETPFSGTVPLCAEIEIGKNREKVDVVLKHNEKVTHTVKSRGYKSSASAVPVKPLTPPPAPIVPTTTASDVFGFKDSRDNKTYKITKIGNQTWMAENLNYNASGSKCYENNESNCQKYGRLYYWDEAKKACPKGWHLPSNEEWKTLIAFAGGSDEAGEHLKAKSGWNINKPSWAPSSRKGLDTYGFAALPGGSGSWNGSFGMANGYWWTSTKNNNDDANFVSVSDAFDYVEVDKIVSIGSYLYSVRCVMD